MAMSAKHCHAMGRKRSLISGAGPAVGPERTPAFSHAYLLVVICRLPSGK